MTKTAAARDFKLIDMRAEARRMVADNPIWMKLLAAQVQANNYCGPDQSEEVRAGTLAYLAKTVSGFLPPDVMTALGRQAVDFNRRAEEGFASQCRFEIDYNTSLFNGPFTPSPEARLHAAVEVEKHEEYERRALEKAAALGVFAAAADPADIGVALVVDLVARVAEAGMAEGAASLMEKIDAAYDAEGAVRRALAAPSADVLLGALRDRTLPKPSIHPSAISPVFH